jgi:outer membrane protein assembly factor BamB
MSDSIERKSSRRGKFSFACGALALLVFGALADAALADRRLSTQQESRRLGLKRAWFTQVRLDPARHRVQRAVLTGDRLSVLTTAGVLQELNALTGETLWIAPVGNSRYPSLGPAANDQHVALVNGSTLYVLDRTDGRPVLIRQVGGAPGAAPAVSREHVFVPLVSGRIEAYSLGEEKFTPWYYQSFGKGMVAPLTTPASFVWATDSGHLYVGRTGELSVSFRLETRSEIIAPPAYHSPYIYAATVSGEVFAMHEMSGERRWKYATGFPIVRSPAPVADRVFITSDEPALHCVDATRGTSLWEAPRISQFAALTSSRVYGVDELGGLVALDAKSGALLGRMPTDLSTHALVNDQTDRIYLVSSEGMVQCFHELDATEPLYHKLPPTDEPPTSEPGPTTPAESQAPATTAPPEPEAEEDTSPFAEETDEAEMPAEESPFGGEEANDNLFDF